MVRNKVMDGVVRVMRALGIITTATFTLEAGGDKGPLGLCGERVPHVRSALRAQFVEAGPCGTSTFQKGYSAPENCHLCPSERKETKGRAALK